MILMEANRRTNGSFFLILKIFTTAIALIIIALVGLNFIPVSLHAQSPRGDANNDNKVDGIDYVIWLLNFNKQAMGASRGDFNDSGFVDGVDYVIWLQNFNGNGDIPTPTTSSGTSSLKTYPSFGGSTYLSPDYEITLQQGSAQSVGSFAFYSFQKPSYPMYDGTGTLIQNFTPNFRHNTVRHSSSIFSFGGSPVTARVKVKPGAPHITLPLTSCKILPSFYNIPCTVSGTDTMVFTMTKPAKVFVIANYDVVWNKYVTMGQGHKSISAWREYSAQKTRQDYHDVNSTEISQGYKNPFIVIAHDLESTAEVPSKTGALVINPGQQVTQTLIDSASVIWFTPGVHDYSGFGTSPGNQIIFKKGQTVYLEGGAYVISRFKRSSAGTGITRLLGRGVLSGTNLKWVKKERHLSAVLLDIDEIRGITITDRAAYGIERIVGSPADVPMQISDIAMIGSWHGNTDSIEGQNATMEDSLLMAFDDNLKLKEQFQARRLVIWQGANAHPIMIHENTNRDLSASIAEDIDIVAYTRTPPNGADTWDLVSSAAIASVRGGNSTASNFTFRNIRIESPYLNRVIAVYNLNTNIINPGWFSPTSETNHSRVNGMLFQNITVTSPIIALESLLGSAYTNSINNVTIQNLNIQATKVIETNKDGFFEFEGAITGLTFPQ